MPLLNIWRGKMTSSLVFYRSFATFASRPLVDEIIKHTPETFSRLSRKKQNELIYELVTKLYFTDVALQNMREISIEAGQERLLLSNKLNSFVACSRRLAKEKD